METLLIELQIFSTPNFTIMNHSQARSPQNLSPCINPPKLAHVSITGSFRHEMDGKIIAQFYHCFEKFSYLEPTDVQITKIEELDGFLGWKPFLSKTVTMNPENTSSEYYEFLSPGFWSFERQMLYRVTIKIKDGQSFTVLATAD